MEFGFTGRASRLRLTMQGADENVADENRVYIAGGIRFSLRVRLSKQRRGLQKSTQQVACLSSMC